MKSFIAALLFVHIAAGILSFISGIVAIASKKGGNIHRLSGKLYLIGMSVIALTAIGISIYRDNLFLLLIAGFSFYMLWAGVRSIYNKSLRPSIFDWFFLVIGFITCTVMLLTGHVVLLVFGGLFAVGLFREFLLFIRILKGMKPEPKAWLLRHIGMILGSFIATTTAFILTNLRSFEPHWIPWLAPTIIGTPLIVYYSAKVRRGKS